MSDANNNTKGDTADVAGPDPFVELADAITPLIPLLAGYRGVLVVLKQLALAQLAGGPSISGPAWKALHDTCCVELGEKPSGTAQVVTGKPAMTVPRFPNPPPPPRNGASAAWPGQGEGTSSSSTSTPVSTVPIGDIRKRDDVARELARITRTLHPGAVAPTDKDS